MSANLRIEIHEFCTRLRVIQRELEKGVDERIKEVDLSDGVALAAALLALKLFREFNAEVEDDKLLENKRIKDPKDFIYAHEKYFNTELRDKIKVKLEERERMENSSKVIIHP